jgi:hypothetical protein
MTVSFHLQHPLHKVLCNNATPSPPSLPPHLSTDRPGTALDVVPDRPQPPGPRP